MTLQDFISQNIGLKGVGNTSENKGQCVGVVMSYLASQDLQHIWGHAFDLLKNANKNIYDVIPNTPEAIPQAGDIVVWNKGFNGTYGHTAIATGKGDVNSFEVFEQNNPLGGACRLHTYKNYNYVDGWIRAKKAVAQPSPEPFSFTDQTLIPGHLLGKKDALEIQQIRGLLVDKDRLEGQLQGAEDEARSLKKQQDDWIKIIEDTKVKLAACEASKTPPKTGNFSLADISTSDLCKEILRRFSGYAKIRHT